MPQPVDLSFGGRPGTVVFHRPSDGAEVGSCVGPGSDGRCPRALGGQVPCAGCILSLPLAVRGARDWHVPEGYRTCFLGGYDVYRQAG